MNAAITQLVERNPSKVEVASSSLVCRSKDLNRSMLGLWCNGNTSVFGAEFPGSNPGGPAIFGLMVELADALDLGSSPMRVWVRVPLSPQKIKVKNTLLSGVMVSTVVSKTTRFSSNLKGAANLINSND